jgi:uncharacterized protein (DUF1800 family)
MAASLAPRPRTPRGPSLSARHWLLGATAACLLSACGGGDGSATTDTTAAALPQREVSAAAATPAAVTGTTRADAFRLLTQASFGPTEASLSRAMSLGAAGWVDEQLALPASHAHLARYNADVALWTAQQPGSTPPGPRFVISSFYERALRADDQLRQRVAFALSEIFVVSLAELSNTRAQSVAAYHDLLSSNAFGNYRQLLQGVALSPAMGMYLSSLSNRAGDAAVGRIPDQNFAREVMQLFSIGLRQLNADGSARLDAQGQPIDTYGNDDIVGLSNVFTGYSWAGPDTSDARFWGRPVAQDAKRFATAMQPYAAFHSGLAKNFLGTSLPARNAAAADLQAALDTLAKHPNVGPFIGRQLIQRLVTSHPSPAYVARVAAVFNDNGAGVRGDLQAVVRAILLDNEARSASPGSNFGKLREPVLRFTALLRAFNASSDSGKVLMPYTDDPATSLGQSPLAAPSVFNFFRPGYTPPGGEAAALGLTLPEMQIDHESSAAGSTNYLLGVLDKGAGLKGFTNTAKRLDLQLDLTAAAALADQPTALVEQVSALLLGESASTTLKAEVAAAVSSVNLPKLQASGANQALVAKARLNRARVAIALVLASPDFIVQN